MIDFSIKNPLIVNLFLLLVVVVGILSWKSMPEEMFPVVEKDDKDEKSGKIWIPQMIFGQLLTSGNYDKSKKKIIGGKNGFGAKLVNIFSKKFTVPIIFVLNVSTGFS